MKLLWLELNGFLAATDTVPLLRVLAESLTKRLKLMTRKQLLPSDLT